jgi:cell division protein FtsB
MNQPTREEFEQLKAQVKRLEEQQTEPIKITDTILLQTLVTMAGNQATDVALLKGDVSVLKTEMKEVRADIASIKATQSDHGELLREILSRLPEKGQ